jgi:uncharacterized secreted protein with C-terminal beta-propeller domain
VQLASSLRQFDSCDGVRAWARDELAPRVGAYGFPGTGGPWMAAESMEEDLATSAADGDSGTTRAAAPAAGGSANFSGTNVQVEGVDEPDQVKTDGTRIVAVVDGKLRLVSANDARVLDTLDLAGEMYDSQVLLAGDRVLVIAQTYGPIAGPAAADIALPTTSSTRIMQVDIAGDRLVAGETYLLDGSFVSARMTGDVARIVVHADPQASLPFVTPANPGDEASARAHALNREVVEAAAAEEFLPKWHAIDADGAVQAEGALLDCADAHAPNTFSGFGMVTVVSVDLSDGIAAGIASSRASGVMAGGQTVYASPDHLYVAAPEWVDWERVTSRTPTGVAAETHGTDIHRFDISDPRRARYEMSGHVDGTLLNQFAMDEHDGNLRVATTVGMPWMEGDGESESHVSVLAPVGDALQEIGRVGGLGRGETIRSVRFLGDVGYVVTFEQTDPLYTIDLTDPANPRTTGELKILGYSAYLHPIGDGRLIGVGQDATEEGRTTGVQVALFDVRDPAAPARVAQATIPAASSSAEWDHHAFLWWDARDFLAVPVSSYEPRFEGVIAYTVDAEAGTVQEAGRVAHPATGFDDTGFTMPEMDPSARVGDGNIAPMLFQPSIVRSLVIGDQLWTMSSAGFAVTDMASMAQAAFVPFS